ncbi:hypothetical protein [Bordetella sp. LUAb4]|uniref:hypothetical protein n=1 Tax=Bordetella sp. LUAb4 TaxID=2843195 RepID=UPI001E2BFD06|nr:hypothetical protein [Bordetella sp. LUAb4]
MINLNNLRDNIRVLAEMANGPFLEEEWNIDYGSDLNNLLDGDLDGLKKAAGLLNASLGGKDLIVAQCALLRVQLYAMQISNSFLNIGDDIEKIFLTKEIKLPDIPEGYQIPDSYNYKEAV